MRLPPPPKGGGFPLLRSYYEWRARYRFLLSQAEYVKVMEPAYTREAYQERNEWMVNHSAKVIAVYSGQSGDTRNLIRYARLCRVPVLCLKG